MKESLYNWVVFHPLYTINNQGQLVTAQMDVRVEKCVFFSKSDSKSSMKTAGYMFFMNPHVGQTESIHIYYIYIYQVQVMEILILMQSI